MVTWERCVNAFVLLLVYLLSDFVAAGLSLRYCYSYCDSAGYYKSAITCNSALSFCCWNSLKRSKYCCSDLTYMIHISKNVKGVKSSSCRRSSKAFVPSWTWISGGVFLLFFLVMMVILRRYRARRLMQQRVREMATTQATVPDASQPNSYPAQINPSFTSSSTAVHTTTTTTSIGTVAPFTTSTQQPVLYPQQPSYPSQFPQSDNPPNYDTTPGEIPSLPAYTVIDTPPPSYDTIFPTGGPVQQK
ncbi:uncharacterized protein LOC141915069 [Tubulanus polymorphus]|uniref:uncharacterized protein LOC141915069 n=1 Tax=Tubulanus polymorphus TaxID=672921 RepID=UPI003DA2C1B7